MSLCHGLRQHEAVPTNDPQQIETVDAALKPFEVFKVGTEIQLLTFETQGLEVLRFGIPPAESIVAENVASVEDQCGATGMTDKVAQYTSLVTYSERT